MARKKICQAFIISLALAISPLYAETTTTELNTQTVQITVRLQHLYGHPSWTLILRDEDSQQVYPYVFDFSKPNQFWIAYTHTRHYRIVQSSLQFGPYGNLYNFCHLENRSFTDESLFLNIRGNLSPVANTSACDVSAFKNTHFPVVENLPDPPETTAEDNSTPEANTPITPPVTVTPLAPSTPTTPPTNTQTIPPTQ